MALIETLVNDDSVCPALCEVDFGEDWNEGGTVGYCHIRKMKELFNSSRRSRRMTMTFPYAPSVPEEGDSDYDDLFISMDDMGTNSDYTCDEEEEDYDEWQGSECSDY